MTTPSERIADRTPPSLQELTGRFLAAKSSLAGGPACPAGGEVDPHEVASGFRTDPRSTWADAVAALGSDRPAPAVPAEWAAAVAQAPAAVAVPFCLGNYPQRVRDVQPLLAGSGFDRVAPVPAGSLGSVEKAKKGRDFAHVALAAGLARAAGEFDAAAELLTLADGLAADPASKAVCRNEWAALAWHRGDTETAERIWSELPESGVGCFNRGLARLFAGDPDAAKPALARAAELLPEPSGWGQLAQLYSALADIRQSAKFF